MKTAAVVLFVVMYTLMIVRPKWRTWTALAAAVLFALAGILPAGEIFGAIDFNVLMMIAGTMVVVDFFIESKMPNLIADCLLDRAPNVMWVTIFMSLFAGAVSAFIDNVATVLMVAPVGLAVCRKLKIDPVPMILSIAVSSNLQGAATLVGDTTSIMLGSYAGMSFTDFFWMNGKPGIFFAVELGALATVPVMMFVFRDMKEPVEAKEFTKVTDYFPTVMLAMVVVLLILASFVPDKPSVTNGVICCCLGLISMVYDRLRTKSFEGCRRALKGIDKQTIILLASLFVVIGGLTNVGIIDDVAGWIGKVGGGNLFLLYSIIVWGSVAISAFIDNIPYVATMLPVVRGVAAALGIPPYLLYFGLLSGATLGGNLTPVGASANITALGILFREGRDVSMKEFFKIGIPFTLTAVTVGYIFLWLVWG